MSASGYTPLPAEGISVYHRIFGNADGGFLCIHYIAPLLSSADRKVSGEVQKLYFCTGNRKLLPCKNTISPDFGAFQKARFLSADSA
jgi:hypothetical protein